MPYWAILILTIVAMVAILVVFMWWWTTERWDWASAELKPPRPVPPGSKLHHHPLTPITLTGRLDGLERDMERVLTFLDLRWAPRGAATPSTDSLPAADSPMQRRRQAWKMGSPGGSALKGGKIAATPSEPRRQATAFDETHKHILSSDSLPDTYKPEGRPPTKTTSSPSSSVSPDGR